MDPQVSTTEASPPPVTPPIKEPARSNHIMIISLSIFILLALSAIIFLFNQNQSLKNMLAQSQSTPTVIATPSPTESPDPTIGWKTYVNNTQGISFKYPSELTIDTKGEKGDTDQGYNGQVTLKMDKVNLVILMNMMGIGGKGSDLQGTAIVIDGHDLYKYKAPSGTQNSIGITDILKESLGVFKINDKTYSIKVFYPNTYTDTQAAEIETVFDQILSTFKFVATPTPKPTATMSPTN